MHIHLNIVNKKLILKLFHWNIYEFNNLYGLSCSKNKSFN